MFSIFRTPLVGSLGIRPGTLLPVLLLATLSSGQPGQDPMNRITIRGKPMFMNGINMAWNRFGEDLTQYDANVFGSMFRNLAEAGGNSVRWWVHCNGQSTPSFDGQGKVTGMSEQAFANMGKILDQAAESKILLMPVLWSFDMANNKHANLVSDSALTNSYIRTVVTPLVTRYKGHPGLLAWEICNEPEWMLDDDGSTNQRVTKVQLQRFHGLIAAAIHRADPAALVTTGSASLKWNSTAPAAKGNYFSDQALQAAAGGDPLARLDFYQIHYYSWMRGAGYTYSPWDKRASYWGLDKPVIIGELPAAGEAGYLNAVQMHVGSVDSGYAGCPGRTWTTVRTRWAHGTTPSRESRPSTPRSPKPSPFPSRGRCARAGSPGPSRDCGYWTPARSRCGGSGETWRSPPRMDRS
jgi:hypothetical protein